MNSVIRSIRTPRPVVASEERLNQIEGEIITALLSKETVFDGETEHTFEDVLHGIWSKDSSAELIDNELKNIAMGDSQSLAKIQNILTSAAQEYAQSISMKVAEYRFKEAADNFIASINTNEFQELRGRV